MPLWSRRCHHLVRMTLHYNPTHSPERRHDMPCAHLPPAHSRIQLPHGNVPSTVLVAVPRPTLVVCGLVVPQTGQRLVLCRRRCDDGRVRWDRLLGLSRLHECRWCCRRYCRRGRCEVRHVLGCARSRQSRGRGRAEAKSEKGV